MRNSLISLLGLSFLPFATVHAGSPSGEQWVGNRAPEIAGGNWINSSPLTIEGLKGKVVLLEFWTFGCYNCRNTLPSVRSWHEKYASQGLTIIGVHTPEFETEKNLATVRRRVADLGIAYPVVTDNEYRTWDAYHQQYWPVLYLVDKTGLIRYVHIGEGRYQITEDRIRKLLSED